MVGHLASQALSAAASARAEAEAIATATGSPGALARAAAAARAAHRDASEAFFHPTILPQLYFPSALFVSFFGVLVLLSIALLRDCLISTCF